MEAKKLPVGEIEATGKTQVRVRLDTQTIDDYASDMQNGDIFPPLTVYAEDESERYILADGFHRLAAATKLGVTEIDCLVYDGGLADALMFALSANRANGLRRSNADKHHAAVMAVNAPSLKQMGLRELAEICGVSHELIRTVKAEQNEGEKKPKKSKPAVTDDVEENVRPTKPKPNQADVDAGEFAQAIQIIRSFPYGGHEALERMNLSELVKADVNYCADWLDAMAASLGDEHE